MAKLKELSIKEIQSSIFEIMKDIDIFCRENGIRYTLSCGTLLGAVRHGGFIPWDDDADIFMLREDFDRFVKSYKSKRFHLLFNSRNKDEFLAYGFAKICDPETYIPDSKTMIKHGVFVDVFPLDSVPEEPEERMKYIHKVLSTHNRLYHRHKKDLVSIIKSYRHSFDWWFKRLDGLVHTEKYRNSPLAAYIVGSNNYRTIITKDRFDSLVEIPFEGYNFLCFKDTDSYLKLAFGPDYMTPKKWSPHINKVYRKDERQDK